MVILSVCVSVRPSVTRVLSVRLSHAFYDKKNITANILMPHKRVITLVVWHQQRLMAISPFTWNLRLNWLTFLEKRQLWPIFAYNVWTVRSSEKFSIIANRKSTTRFPTSCIWSAYIRYPTPRKGWLKQRICRFMNKTKVRSNSLLQSFFVWKHPAEKL